MNSNSIPDHDRTGGIFGWFERSGNRLPDPMVIFLYGIFAMVVIVNRRAKMTHLRG